MNETQTVRQMAKKLASNFPGADFRQKIFESLLEKLQETRTATFEELQRRAGIKALITLNNYLDFMQERGIISVQKDRVDLLADLIPTQYYEKSFEEYTAKDWGDYLLNYKDFWDKIFNIDTSAFFERYNENELKDFVNDYTNFVSKYGSKIKTAYFQRQTANEQRLKELQKLEDITQFLIDLGFDKTSKLTKNIISYYTKEKKKAIIEEVQRSDIYRRFNIADYFNKIVKEYLTDKDPDPIQLAELLETVKDTGSKLDTLDFSVLKNNENLQKYAEYLLRFLGFNSNEILILCKINPIRFERKEEIKEAFFLDKIDYGIAGQVKKKPSKYIFTYHYPLVRITLLNCYLELIKNNYQVAKEKIIEAYFNDPKIIDLQSEVKNNTRRPTLFLVDTKEIY